MKGLLVAIVVLTGCLFIASSADAHGFGRRRAVQVNVGGGFNRGFAQVNVGRRGFFRRRAVQVNVGGGFGGVGFVRQPFLFAPQRAFVQQSFVQPFYGVQQQVILQQGGCGAFFSY